MYRAIDSTVKTEPSLRNPRRFHCSPVTVAYRSASAPDAATSSAATATGSWLP